MKEDDLVCLFVCLFIGDILIHSYLWHSDLEFGNTTALLDLDALGVLGLGLQDKITDVDNQLWLNIGTLREKYVSGVCD